MKKITLEIQDNGNRNFETIGDLLKQIEDDKEFYKKEGREQEFLDSPITLQLNDIEGQIAEGRVCLCVGSCTDDKFILVGNIENTLYEKHILGDIEDVVDMESVNKKLNCKYLNNLLLEVANENR